MIKYYDFINEELAKIADIKVGDYLFCGGNLGNVKTPVNGKIAKVIDIKKVKPKRGYYAQSQTEYTLKFDEVLKVRTDKFDNHTGTRKIIDTDTVVITHNQLKLLNVISEKDIEKFKRGGTMKYEASGPFKVILKHIKFKVTSNYNDISFFNVDEENSDIITYVPLNKYKLSKEEKEDPYKSRFRQQSKIGRILKKLNPSLNDKEIENYVDSYRAIWNNLFKHSEDRLRLVNGDAITFWYHNQNYVKGGGSLNGSCMRHDSTQKRVGFYAMNPDKIALCILLDENNKLLARALVWKLDDPKDVIFMDRIYSVRAEHAKILENYAVKQGWQTKVSGYQFKKKLTVNLENMPPISYPYMDTFSPNGKKGLKAGW